jgi:hypothetical protein
MKDSMDKSKIIAVLLFLVLSVSFPVSADELSKSLFSQYGPNKTEFLEMCKPHINEKLASINPCYIYFIGLRNGYLVGDKKANDRAALYYALDGKVAPAGDLQTKYWLKAKNAFEHEAFRQLDGHKVNCVRIVEVETLLRDFYKFLQKHRRNNGVTILFDEFVQTRYAGKCK